MRNDKILALGAIGVMCILMIDYDAQRKKVDELQLKNSNLLQQYNTLKGNWDEYVTSKSYPHALASALDNLKKQLSQTNLELAQAKNALDRSKERCKSFELSNANLNADKRILSEKLSSTELRLYTKQAALVEAEEQVLYLRNKNDELRLQPQYELVRQNERLKHKVDSQQSEAMNSNIRIMELADKLRESETNLINATNKLNRVLGELNALQSRYNILEQSQSGQQRSVMEEQSLRNELKKMQKEKQEKEIEIRESYKDLEGLHKTYAKDKNRLEGIITALKDKLKKIRDGEHVMQIKAKL